MGPTLKEARAEAYVDHALWVSLHTGEPGESGDFQLGDRQEITWVTTGNPGERIAGPFIFEIDADTDLTHVGIWDAETGGEFADSRINSVSFPTAGTYTITLTHTEN